VAGGENGCEREVKERRPMQGNSGAYSDHA
jgi:hypothetical protein